MKVGHEEQADGSGGIKEEQEASREVKEKPTPVYYQQACQLLRQHQLEGTEEPVPGQVLHGVAPNPVSIELLHTRDEVHDEDLATQNCVVPKGHVSILLSGIQQAIHRQERIYQGTSSGLHP